MRNLDDDCLLSSFKKMRDLNTPFTLITGKLTLSMGGWMKSYTVYPCR